MTIKPWVAYDLTRLFLGPWHMTPRGIDRVELAYARYFLNEWPGDASATLPTIFGVRTLDRRAALRVVEHAERCWGERHDPDQDDLMERLTCRLESGGEPQPIIRSSTLRRALAMSGQVLRNAGCALGPLAADALPGNALYLNIGQIGIAVPQFVSWLKVRPDVRPVFMLHDVIPIEHSEYVPPISTFFHRRMVDHAAAYAAGLITTTKAAANAIGRELSRRGRNDMPVAVEPLPASPLFMDAPRCDARLAAVPYFVIVSSIEPRKNHALLMQVWDELVRLEGPRAPKLVIAGTRWRGHEAVTGPLMRSPALRDRVIEIGGLASPSLQKLLSNARGLLMPSFIEGFGMPIVEAQALGIPVIASDIAAHREAGKDWANYLGSTDVSGWLAAIRNLMNAPAPAARPRDATTTWGQYFLRIEPFLTDIGVARSLDPEIRIGDIGQAQAQPA